jgi:MFS transporter, SP family, sugar:H+ symporter
MTTASNWLLNFAIAYATPYMVNPAPEGESGYANMGSRVFFVWGSFCFICIFFVWYLIYETKGLSLEQVDELYGIVSKAWQSKKFRPAVSFQDEDVMASAKRGESLSEMAQRKASVGHAEKNGAE